MKLVIPNNLFSALFTISLPENIKSEITVNASPIISNVVADGKADIGLIPSLDLISHPELFVSSKYAISFDGDLSNSYIYFKSNGEDLKNFRLHGDVSSNEVLLSRIIFAEKYDTQIDTVLDNNPINKSECNYIACGNENFEENLFRTGISFADEVAEMIEFPYVNYLIASNNPDNIKMFENSISDISEIIDGKLEEMLNRFNPDAELNTFIVDNFNSVYYDLTVNEIDGLKELLSLPFIHGLMGEMVDIKFAE